MYYVQKAHIRKNSSFQLKLYVCTVSYMHTYTHIQRGREREREEETSYDEEQIRACRFGMLLYSGIFKSKNKVSKDCNWSIALISYCIFVF